MNHDTKLPAVQELARLSAAAPMIDAEFETQPAHVPLAHYLWILRRHGWRIAGFVAATMIATLLVSLRLTPIYESTATVDIDRQMPSGIIGSESTRPVSNDSDQYLATQIKLIQSDSVLRPVGQQYQLLNAGADTSHAVSLESAAAAADPP